MVMIRCREDLDKGVESFDKLVAEVKAVAKDQEEELELLTERVLIDLIQSRFGTRKSKETAAHKVQVEKKKYCKVSFKKLCKERSKEPYGARNNQLMMKRKRSFEEYEDGEYDPYIEDNACKLMRKKKKKMKAKEVNMQPDLARSDLPIEFMNKIKSLNGSQVKLVIEKTLTSTDLSTHHDRLAIPPKQARNMDFLDTFEKEFEDKVGIPVRFITPSLQESELCLRRWKMTSRYMYALNSGWKSIFTDKREKLELNDTIQLWWFSVNNQDLTETQLCFALVNLGYLGKEDTNSTTGSSGTSRQTNDSSVTKNQSVEQPRLKIKIKCQN